MTLETYERAVYIQRTAKPNFEILRYDIFSCEDVLSNRHVGELLRAALGLNEDFKQEYLELMDKYIKKLNKEFNDL